MATSTVHNNTWCKFSPVLAAVSDWGLSHRVQFLSCLKNRKHCASKVIWNGASSARTGDNRSEAIENASPLGSSTMNGYSRLMCGIHRLYARSCLLHHSSQRTTRLDIKGWMASMRHITRIMAKVIVINSVLIKRTYCSLLLCRVTVICNL